MRALLVALAIASSAQAEQRYAVPLRQVGQSGNWLEFEFEYTYTWPEGLSGFWTIVEPTGMEDWRWIEEDLLEWEIDRLPSGQRVERELWLVRIRREIGECPKLPAPVFRVIVDPSDHPGTPADPDEQPLADNGSVAVGVHSKEDGGKRLLHSCKKQ